ncbi:hypothetical protein Tco_1211513 [Tanacetum coccineum]
MTSALIWQVSSGSSESGNATSLPALESSSSSESLATFRAEIAAERTKLRFMLAYEVSRAVITTTFLPRIILGILERKGLLQDRLFNLMLGEQNLSRIMELSPYTNIRREAYDFLEAPVLLKWFVSRDVPTGAPSSNGTIIPIPIPSFPLLVYLHSRKFIRSTDGAKSGVLVRASRPILLPDIIGRSSSETRARKALFRFVPVLHFLLIEKKGDFSYLESFCGVLRLLFFRTFFSLPRDRSAKRERARRRKGQPNGNEQGRNDKMRCPGHPHLERRVEVFGPVALPVPPSSGGACVGGAPAEIGLEALTLPTSRQLMAVGHDYYKKAPMKMNISHGGVCIFMLGVLLSCDPAAYVRPVAHASYLFRAGGVNSDSIRVTPVGEVALSIPSGQPGREHGGDGLPKKPARAGAWARKQEAMAFALVGAIKHLRLFHSILKLDRKVETFRGILFLRDALLRYDGLFDSLSAPLLLLSCEWGVEYSESTGLVGKPKKSRDKEQSRNKEPEGKSKRDMDQILLPQNTRALRDGFKLCSDKGIQVNDIESDSKVMVDSILDKATQLQTDWLLMLTLTGLIASLKRLLFSCKQAYYNDKEGLDSYSCSRNAFFHQSHVEEYGRRLSSHRRDFAPRRKIRESSRKTAKDLHRTEGMSWAPCVLAMARSEMSVLKDKPKKNRYSDSSTTRAIVKLSLELLSLHFSSTQQLQLLCQASHQTRNSSKKRQGFINTEKGGMGRITRPRLKVRSVIQGKERKGRLK